MTKGRGAFETRPYRECDIRAGNTGMAGTEAGPTVECSADLEDSIRFRSPTLRLTVTLQPPKRDLSEFNQLSAKLFNCTASPLLVGVKLIHGSETGGFGTSDVSLSGGREELLPGVWADLRFPVESFGTYGTPPHWKDIREIELSFSHERNREGGEHIELEMKSMTGELLEIPDGPRLTLEGLAHVLNPDLRGGAQLLEGQRGAVGGAREIWSPGPPYVADDSGLFIPPPYQYPRESADEILRGRIMGRALGYPFAWGTCPSGVLEWCHFLNRHHFMRQLLIAFVETRDERYVRELDRLISSWIDSNPVPVGSNGGAGPSWETLSVAWRLREWLWVAGIAWSAEGFRESAKLEMLRSIWEHARSLMDHRGHPNNWIIVESSSLALAGICFPEFREAGLWVQTGMERLETEFHRQFFEDGVHFEISPLYHAICLHAMLEVKQAAAARGMPLPAIFSRPLERCFDYLAALRRPDFTWPSLNDAGSVSSDYTDLMRTAGEVFQREDFKWIGSRGGRGTPPPDRFRVFPDAGIAAFRSDHHPDANFLVFRAGPPGAAHVHGDALSIDVTALGVPRLVDPGITTYAPDKLTQYYRSSAAHNVILIDNCGPDRSTLRFREKVRGAGPDFSSWSDESLDVVTGVCRGPWEGVRDKYVLTRTVVFVKPDYWIVRDVIEGSGEHEISACWQFYPGRVEVDIKTLAARCVDARGPGFELMPLLADNRADIEISTGLLSPPRGWVSLNGSDVPATSCIYRMKTFLPITLIWLLLPFDKGSVSGIQAIRRDTDLGEVILEIQFQEERSDLIRLGKERVEAKVFSPKRL
ncbi:MAG: alginate lyase family protein [Desulfomonilaceae bacterium]